ncbi:MAG: hypothetical protein JHC93_08765 [Parachlamydiales bacterium]|nr:hypothetical protein [Parachlamydiales bacterium]
MGDSIYTLDLDGQKIKEIPSHYYGTSTLRHFDFTAATLFNDEIVVGCKNGDIIFYDKNLHIIHYSTTAFKVVALTVCGNNIASANTYNEIYVWSDYKTFKVFKGHTEEITNLQSMGSYLVSTSIDKTIRIWDLDGTSYVINTGEGSIKQVAVIGPQILYYLERKLTLLDFSECNKKDETNLENKTSRHEKMRKLISNAASLCDKAFHKFISKFS